MALVDTLLTMARKYNTTLFPRQEIERQLEEAGLIPNIPFIRGIVKTFLFYYIRGGVSDNSTPAHIKTADINRIGDGYGWFSQQRLPKFS